MSLSNDLQTNNEPRPNIVVKIGTTYFSKRQIDSGFVIDSDKVGMVSEATINPTVIDLKKIKTTINSTTIKILDKEIFTAFMGANANSLIGEEITVYIGLTTGSYDWSDYAEVNKYVIQSIDLAGRTYNIRATSRTNVMQSPAFNKKGMLDTSIDASVTTIIIETIEDIFQSANFIKIEDEFIQYTGKSFSSGLTTLTGCTRGVLSSIGASHSADTLCYEVTKIEGNPISSLLQLMVSPGGGGIYDVLHDGIGIQNVLIDIAKFEQIRTDFFPSDQFRLYLYNIDNMLSFFERELLMPNNCRFVDSEDGISIAALDQSVPGSTLPQFDTTNTLKNPKWRINANRIVNKINIKWGWNEGLKKFTRITPFDDTASQAMSWGVKSGSDLEFKGIQADLGGSSVVNDRGNRFLARFSTPQVEVDAESLLKTYKNNAGDKVLFSSPDVPQEGGGMGISTELELVSKGINWITGHAKWKLVYTSYYNIRRGLIDPSPLIQSVIDQKTFTVPDGTHYKDGYVLRLWDNNLLPNPGYTTDALNTIETISGNQITMKNNFTTTLTTSLKIKLADYLDASAEQKARYAFVCPNSGVFGDGTKGYQIII